MTMTGSISMRQVDLEGPWARPGNPFVELFPGWIPWCKINNRTSFSNPFACVWVYHIRFLKNHWHIWVYGWTQRLCSRFTQAGSMQIIANQASKPLKQAKHHRKPPRIHLRTFKKDRFEILHDHFERTELLPNHQVRTLLLEVWMWEWWASLFTWLGKQQKSGGRACVFFNDNNQGEMLIGL